MAPKKLLKTGGKAGGRAGRPSGPIAGTQDKTARVPASWNARSVDPTNQRGAGQRPTGGMAGGRAGKPSGSIARPAAKPAAKPSGQFKAPSVPKPGTATKPQGTPQAQKWVKENTLNARVARAQQAQNPLNRIGNTIAQAGKSGIGKNLARLANNPATKLLGRAAVVGGIASELNQNLNPNSEMNRRDAELLRRIGNKLQGKPAKPAASTSRFAGARDKAMAKAKGIKGSPVVGPKKPAAKAPSAPARMSAPAARSSAPSAPKAAAPTPSGPARMSASTYNRMSGNYGTSRTNNPLMADFKDSLPSKAAEPDVGYSPKTKVSGEGIKGAPTDVTKLAFSNPKLSAERTKKIKRG